jgi:hypothetical protein
MRAVRHDDFRSFLLGRVPRALHAHTRAAATVLHHAGDLRAVMGYVGARISPNSMTRRSSCIASAGLREKRRPRRADHAREPELSEPGVSQLATFYRETPAPF